jgi:hypothetical protein
LLLTGYGTPWMHFGVLWSSIFRVVSLLWCLEMSTICHLSPPRTILFLLIIFVWKFNPTWNYMKKYTLYIHTYVHTYIHIFAYIYIYTSYHWCLEYSLIILYTTMRFRKVLCKAVDHLFQKIKDFLGQKGTSGRTISWQ